MRLLLLLHAAHALNVTVVPSYFRSQKERKVFSKYGRWQVDERRCDKFIRNRAYDKTCQKYDPKPNELLPLLVTGAPGCGTRVVFELIHAMCHKATRECRQYPEYNATLDSAIVLARHGATRAPWGTPGTVYKNPCCEVCHEGYGDMATVSSVHAVNEITMGVPYPHTDERSGWWLKRQIVDRHGLANAFTPRYRRVVHLIRCPFSNIQTLLKSKAPLMRFVEAFTDPPLQSICVHHACSANFEERLGWAVAAYVAWTEHIDLVAHETLRIDAFDFSNSREARLERAERLCILAFLNKDRKPHGCADRKRKLFETSLGRNETRPPPLLTLQHLTKAVWPPHIDGDATSQRLQAFCAKHGFDGACAGNGAHKEVHWDLDDDHLKEGALPPSRMAPAPTKLNVEACLLSDSCSPFATCPPTAARDCLRAAVPFRTPLSRTSCCFRCCLEHWLSNTRLGRNLESAGAGMLEVSEAAKQHYNKPNPDSGDFGLAPRTNVLAHPHMFAAVADVHVHPMKGCRVVDERDFEKSYPLLAALYHIDPNAAFRDAATPFGATLFRQYPCLNKLKSAVSVTRKVVTDYFMPVRWAPENPLQNMLKLGLANNLKNSAGYRREGVGRAVITRERVIGVRGPSLWQAALEHPGYDRLPRYDERLLLCCCMNVDEKHPKRLKHYLMLNRHPEFGCAAREKKHLGEPVNDPREHAIENDINLMLNGRYGSLVSMLGNFDAHLPVLMRGSRFVFSPNGVGEQCYREYEALVAGTYPLVDATDNRHRNAILDQLPVVRVKDWRAVTPTYLRAKASELDGKDWDVSILYLPYWYDVLITALELA